MAKFVFINLPIESHVNPTLPVVQELVARGEDVVYYLTDKYKHAIEATGATFRRYESKTEQLANDSRTTGKAAALPMRMVEESLFVLPQLIDRVQAEQADCIVYDTMCLSGRLVAQILHIPAVLCRPILVFTKKLAQMFLSRAIDPQGLEAFHASVEILCATYPVQPFDVASIFLYEEALNIVSIPRAFQSDGDSFGDQFRFVGPCIAPRSEVAEMSFEQFNDQPIIYITQGTVYNDRLDFFNMCIAAFGDKPWQVIMSIGKVIDQTKLDPIPKNFLVRTHVPQLEVLQHAHICVNHAGMTSIMESLSLGVPMIVIPLQVSDQNVNARRVAELGLGVMLSDDSITAEVLYDAALRITTGPAFYTNVRQMKEEIQKAGGYQRAADVLMEFIKAPV